MARNVETIELDDSGFTSKLEKITEGLADAAKASKKMVEEVNDSTKKSADGVVKASDTIVKSNIKTARSIGEARKELIEAVKGFTLFGFSIQGTKEKTTEFINILKLTREGLVGNINPTKTQAEGIEILTKAFGGGQGAILGMVKGLNILRIAILSTGIGALVLGLGALYTFLTQSQKGMDFLGQKTAYLGGIFGGLKTSAINVGEAIFDSFDKGTVLQDFGNLIKENVENRFAAIDKLASSFDEGFVKGLKNIAGAFLQLFTGVDSDKVAAYKDKLLAVGDASEQIEKEFQSLRREEATLAVTTAQSNQKIKELKLIGEDTTKSFDTRRKAIAGAIGIERTLIEQRVKNAEKELSLIKRKNDLEKKNNPENKKDVDRQKEYDAEIKIAGLRADSADKLTEFQNQLNGVKDQEKAFIKSMEDSFRSLNTAMLEAANNAGFLTDEQYRLGVLKDQLFALEEQKKKYKEISKAIGEDVKPQLELIDMLIKKVTDEATKTPKLDLLPKGASDEITKLQKELERLKNLSINFEIDTKQPQQKIEKLIELQKKLEGQRKLSIEFGINTLQAQKEIQEKITVLENNTVFIPKLEMPPLIPIVDAPDLGGFLDGINNFDDLFNKVLEDIFGEGTENAKMFFNGLGELFGAFNNLLDDNTENQINSIDKQLDKLTERREKLEEGLDDERELYELGLANNLSIKEEEVNGLLAQEEALIAQREELNRKAAQRQLLIDTAQQAQSLVTASINIIKGFSLIPFVGLGLGIAAVGTLAAFFAKTKVDAFKNTRLYDGSDNLGFVKRHGDDDRRLGRGFSIVDSFTGAPTGTLLGGDEMIIPRQYSVPNERFFMNLKNGEYEGVDLVQAVNKKGTDGGSVPNLINIQKGSQRQYITYTNKKGKVVHRLVTIRDNDKDGSEIIFDL